LQRVLILSELPSGHPSPKLSEPGFERVIWGAKEPFNCSGFVFAEVIFMSKETPTSDPGQRTDWGSAKQTDKPWKGNPEKEQRNGDTKPDLEKWQESSTH
jgi:hypothetical protein